jgi:DNA polymerase III epsilon subunit family exonuclease
MTWPANLVPDSTLTQDAYELLRLCGGRAPVEQVAELILGLPQLDRQTATPFVEDLIREDWRMRLADGATVELTCVDEEARALCETDFVVVDVETTDARTPPGRIAEIGAYRVSGRRITGEFHSLVNPLMRIPSFIVGLTGITDEMVEAAPLFADIAAAWLEFAGAAVIVAHNAAFDVRFLNHELSFIYPGRRMANTSLCTVTLTRQLMPELANHRLHTVAEHFSVPIPRRHRAPDDARATAEIFIRLLAQLDAHGVRDLATARQFKVEAGVVSSLRSQVPSPKS